ncbi:hypothetical protein KGQ24_01470 [Patescibacteria group bacterium]|nr:hypothetical protein [Patescibacteria group bacterium]
MATAKVGKPRKIRPLTRAQRRMVREEIERQIDPWKEQLNIASDQREEARYQLQAEKAANAGTSEKLQARESRLEELEATLVHERLLALEAAESHRAMINHSLSRVNDMEREWRDAIRAANRERDAYKEELLAAGKQARRMVDVLFGLVRDMLLEEDGDGKDGDKVE